MVNITGTTTWEAPRNPWKSCGRSWNCRSCTPSDFLLLASTRRRAFYFMDPVSARHFSSREFSDCAYLGGRIFLYEAHFGSRSSATSNVPFKNQHRFRCHSRHRKDPLGQGGGEQDRCMLHPRHRQRVGAEVRGRGCAHGARAARTTARTGPKSARASPRACGCPPGRAGGRSPRV